MESSSASSSNLTIDSLALFFGLGDDEFVLGDETLLDDCFNASRRDVGVDDRGFSGRSVTDDCPSEE